MGGPFAAVYEKTAVIKEYSGNKKNRYNNDRKRAGNYLFQNASSPLLESLEE